MSRARRAVGVTHEDQGEQLKGDARTAIIDEPRTMAGTLSPRVKLFYGLPGSVNAAMAVPIVVHMQKFYSDVVLLPVGYIALAIAIARAFDAITDPVMGWISDRTKSRWGRRKPWIFFATPFCSVFFLLLFNPPVALGHSGAAVWFGLSFCAYFLFHTMLQVPYDGLGSELTSDYHERSSLFGWRSMFIGVGTIVAGVLPTILAASGLHDDRAVFRRMSGVYAGLYIAFFALLLLFVRERHGLARRASNPLVPGVRRALRNRPFLIFLAASIIYSIPALIPALLMPYYVQYVLQPDNWRNWLGIYLFLYLATGVLCVPLWIRLSYRFGKLPIWVTCNLIGVLGGALLFFAKPGALTYVAVIEVLVGTQSSAFFFLGPAMVADTIDYDELCTGQRREAQYMAFLAVIPKFVAIPGAAVPLAILGGLGYVPNAAQTADVQFGIRSMFALVPAFFNFAGLFLIWRYPLTEKIHYAIQRALHEHAQGSAGRDPLTGRMIAPHAASAAEASRSWFLDHFSRRELTLLANGGGPAPVSRSVWTMLALSVTVFAAASAWAGSTVKGFAAQPGALTVTLVVVAGLALTSACFHGLRASALSSLRRAPPSRDEARRHVATLTG